MDIYEKILYEIKMHKANLVLVTKTKGTDVISEFYDKGHRDFGENKVQELVLKYEEMPKDIRWHFIGHLQKNKVKYITPFISVIHSVDSFELLKTINESALKYERIIDVLLEMKIAAEETKYGLSGEDIRKILENPQLKSFKNVRICGMMGMATYTDSIEIIAREFEYLKTFFDQVKNNYFREEASFSELSMGMSGDYKIALGQGSTMVRIGSLILGER